MELNKLRVFFFFLLNRNSLFFSYKILQNGIVGREVRVTLLKERKGRRSLKERTKYF